ncbi:MAG: hypothetical protein AB1942_14855 [Pseudomonadota bacterium]
MYHNSTTKSGALSDPIQLRLSPVMVLSLRTAAQVHGRSLHDEIRDRLERVDKFDLQIQGLRAELALQGAEGPRPNDRILHYLLQLLGMVAEVLSFLRCSRPVDTEAAQREVERHKLPVWGRRKEDR